MPPAPTARIGSQVGSDRDRLRDGVGRRVDLGDAVPPDHPHPEVSGLCAMPIACTSSTVATMRRVRVDMPESSGRDSRPQTASCVTAM